jgi:hypothetical protein
MEGELLCGKAATGHVGIPTSFTVSTVRGICAYLLILLFVDLSSKVLTFNLSDSF